MQITPFILEKQAIEHKLRSPITNIIITSKLLMYTMNSIVLGNNASLLKVLLVIAANPESVMWRESKLSDLIEVNPDNFLKPPSVTDVNDRFKLSRLDNPESEYIYSVIDGVPIDNNFTEFYIVRHSYSSNS